jgi:hypothetical protein
VDVQPRLRTKSIALARSEKEGGTH